MLFAIMAQNNTSRSENSAAGTEAFQSLPSSRKARRYGFACTACKTRKVKCSGEQPVCAGCRRSGDVCVWPPSAKSSDSQLLDAANERIRDLEASLGQQPGQSPLEDPRSGSTAPEVTGIFQQNESGSPRGDKQRPASRHQRHPSSSNAGTPRSTSHTTRIRRRTSTHGSGHRPGSLSTTGPSPGSTRRVAEASPNSNPVDATDPGLATSLWYQVGIGEDGAVVYNGPTSRFHAGSLLEGDEDEDSNDNAHKNHVPEDDQGDGSSDDDDEFANGGGLTHVYEPAPGHLATLRSQHDLMDSVWMPLIAAKPKMNGTGVDTKTGVALLDIYWTWLHPLHHLVYRPAFLMDLALGGNHCSDFLLLCIFALAARHLPSESENPTEKDSSSRGEKYVERAKQLLLDEMAASSPTIPTIQGLLILGGRQCAIGQSSQGWLFTGMAIRMMQDIGLHLDTTRLVGLMERWTPAETETRKRLYNAAYVWDKTLSLALGRPPTLIRKPYPPHQILDKFDDQRLWHPIHAKEVARSFEPSPSWVTSTMCVFATLHEITTDMMLLFTRSPGAGKFTEQVMDLDARFCHWYDELPSGLKIDDPVQLKHSPPPHIVSLK